jgi:hypothetical protein
MLLEASIMVLQRSKAIPISYAFRSKHHGIAKNQSNSYFRVVAQIQNILNR